MESTTRIERRPETLCLLPTNVLNLVLIYSPLVMPVSFSFVANIVYVRSRKSGKGNGCITNLVARFVNIIMHLSRHSCSVQEAPPTPRVNEKQETGWFTDGNRSLHF